MQDEEKSTGATRMLIPRVPFARLVREIAQRLSAQNHIHGLRFQHAALSALHEASEAYMTLLFAETMLLVESRAWTCKICGFTSSKRKKFARNGNVQCGPEAK